MVRVKEAAAEAVSEAAALAGRTEPAELEPAKSVSAFGPSQKRRRNQLPDPVRFALVVILSFGFSTLGRLFVDHWTDNELATVARPPASRNEELLATAWKLFGLALGWFANYDGYDLAALALLSHGPATLLLSVFYGIRPMTAGAYLGIEVVSTFLPFLLLRRLSSAHSAAPGIANREIIVDRGIQLLTSLHSSLIYSVVLFLASRTFLPNTFVLHFNGIPTIKPAADAVLFGFGTPLIQALSLLSGLAARTFIFTPLVTTPPTLEDQENAEFDPVSATLGQTVAWNLWGYTSRTKVSIIRTAVAILFTAVGTYMDTALAINGVESYGAVVYASVWVISALVTGLSLRYVGSI